MMAASISFGTDTSASRLAGTAVTCLSGQDKGGCCHRTLEFTGLADQRESMLKSQKPQTRNEFEKPKNEPALNHLALK